jgi:hypothetical protein
MKPSGDHQVKDKPHVVFETDGDALADPPHLFNDPAFRGWKRRVDGTQQKGSGEAYPVKRLSEDALAESFDIYGDIGQLRHDCDG